jgi:hypothetical protein
MVGTFPKGPLNTPTTIGDINALSTTFGNFVAGYTGYASAYGALCQGADDLRIVRIAGAGAACASLTLNDAETTPKPSVIVTALNEGVWGNSTAVTVVNNGKTFDLTLTNGTYSEPFRGLTLVTLSSITSKLVTLAAATGATGIPAVVSNQALTGGNDGAAVADADYIGSIDSNSGKRTGLKALEPVQCGIVLCAQQYSPNLNEALITFDEGCTVQEGLRMA